MLYCVAASTLAALALLIVGGLVFWFAWETSHRGPAARAQETGTSCPNARFIDEFTGTGIQTSDMFRTITGSLFITYDVISANTTGPSTSGDAQPSVNISVLNEQGTSVGSASQNGEGAGETLVSTLPETYSLDIAATGNADYVVSVEECGGNSPSPDQTRVTQRQALTRTGIRCSSQEPIKVSNSKQVPLEYSNKHPKLLS